MRKITGVYPLHVKELKFMDGTKLEDVTCWVLEPFLMVGTDGRPDFYNLSTVAALIGAEEHRPVGTLRMF